MVLGRRQDHLLPVLDRHCGLTAGRVDVEVQRLFREAEAIGRGRQHLVGERETAVQQRLFIDDLADKSRSQCALERKSGREGKKWVRTVSSRGAPSNIKKNQ